MDILEKMREIREQVIELMEEMRGLRRDFDLWISVFSVTVASMDRNMLLLPEETQVINQTFHHFRYANANNAANNNAANNTINNRK